MINYKYIVKLLLYIKYLFDVFCQGNMITYWSFSLMNGAPFSLPIRKVNNVNLL